MKHWRFRAALAAAAVVVVAAVVGAVVVAGPGSDNTTKPAGSENVVRIEAVDTTVPCGPGGATVYIYLDDLARRPSPLNADVSYGVASFELPLRYDPKILQVGRPINVELNPQLDREDDDRDGIVRSFFPVMALGDSEGWALVGAASINPGSQDRPGENQEEGPDPVAKGGPVLLMTVRLQTVGEGTSPVTIEPVVTTIGHPADDAHLYDPSVQLYTPVKVKGTSITVSGGDCSGVVVSTPLPTPKPSSTPYLEPTMTPVVWKTVTPESPSAIGRSDCAANWLAYADPQNRFSICYPADYSVTASDFAVNVVSPRSPGQTDNLVSVIASWNAASGYFFGPPTTKTCPNYTSVVDGPSTSTFTELRLREAVVPACLTVGRMTSSLHGSIP